MFSSPEHDGHPDRDDEREIPAELWATLEATIRASGNYVVPSDQLRPRTLDAAREHCQDRSGNYKFGRFVVLLLLFCGLSGPLVNRIVAWRECNGSPSAVELQERAIQLSADANIGQHWGLLEAFSQLRQDQAARLGHEAAKN